MWFGNGYLSPLYACPRRRVILMYGWEASPLVPVPETERLREINGVNPLGICKGGCNRLCKIQNKTYQICEPCSRKYRYFGRDCDVPNCESTSEGKTWFYAKDGKYICMVVSRHGVKASKAMFGNDLWKKGIYILPDLKHSLKP